VSRRAGAVVRRGSRRGGPIVRQVLDPGRHPALVARWGCDDRDLVDARRLIAGEIRGTHRLRERRHHDLERRGIALAPLQQTPEDRDPLGGLLGTQVEAVPSVAVLGGAAERRTALAAQDDRQATAPDRLGEAANTVDVCELAVEGGDVLAPGGVASGDVADGTTLRSR